MKNKYNWNFLLCLGIFLLPAWSYGQFTLENYDIWVYDTHTGSNAKWVNLPMTGEFNPAWSPDGSQIAFDVVYSGGQTIAISDGSSTFVYPTPDFELANNPSWHPLGTQLLFDKDYSVYLTDPTASFQTLLIPDAYDAQFSHRTDEGPFVVFTQFSTGEIHILNLTTGVVGPSIAAGINARFAPNDRALVYVFDQDIYRIRLNGSMMPVGSPIQVTKTAMVDESRPDWIANNRIVYHSDNGGGLGAYDIYSLKIVGAHSLPTLVTGFPSVGDFDPAYSFSNGKIAYAGDDMIPVPPSIKIDNGFLTEILDHPLRVHPNPSSDYLDITFLASQTGEVKLWISDLTGRVRYTNGRQRYPAGSYTIRIYADDWALAPGVYLLSMQQDGNQKTTKLIIQ